MRDCEIKNLILLWFSATSTHLHPLMIAAIMMVHQPYGLDQRMTSGLPGLPIVVRLSERQNWLVCGPVLCVCVCCFLVCVCV
jgi:hypothetical protein